MLKSLHLIHRVQNEQNNRVYQGIKKNSQEEANWILEKRSKRKINSCIKKCSDWNDYIWSHNVSLYCDSNIILSELVFRYKYDPT